MYDLKREFEKKRVAIYARVSTEHEAQLSALGNQIDWYKPILAAHKEWTLVGEPYIDEGITGTSAEKRPHFMRMMRDAKKHKFDLIITREVSRFARNTVDTLQYTRMLKSVGVEVFFINDNIRTFDGDGELRLTIMATLAQDESRKTSVRVKAGQQTSMENGVFYGNGNILGYDRVGKEMVINEEQAKTVRMIFDMYLNGYGFAKIKYELERQGRLTAMGKEKWFYSVISNILNNSFYCGIMKYHKEYTPDFLEQKKIKNSGEVEYTYVKGRHQPIVSEEEFQRVQDILNEKRGSMKSLQHNQKKPRGHAPSKSVWSRLLVCECGKKLNCHVWNRKNGAVNAGYLCYSQTNHGTVQQKKNHGIKTANSCDTPMIPDWKLKMMAVHIFKNYIADADKVLSLAYEMLEKHIADSEDEPDIATIIEAQNKELEKWEKKLDNYIEMRADGEISKEVFLAKTGDINDRIAEIKKYLMSLQQDNSEVEERDYDSLLEALKKELDAYVDFESSTEIPDQILEAFIEKIVVHKDSFEWHLRIPTANTRCEIGEEEGMTDEVESVIEFLKKEETPTSQKLLISEFTMTKDDALKYMYSIDTRKRVHRWKDFEVRLYA